MDCQRRCGLARCVELCRRAPRCDARRTRRAAGLGTILVGGGAAYYVARNGSGAAASISAGVLGANANLVYQLQIDPHDYLVLGASYGYYFIQYIGWAPVLAYERRF